MELPSTKNRQNTGMWSSSYSEHHLNYCNFHFISRSTALYHM